MQNGPPLLTQLLITVTLQQRVRYLQMVLIHMAALHTRLLQTLEH